jgi:hypothetical protein
MCLLLDCLLLDVVELPISHTGLNLATAFAGVLDGFGISDKVSLPIGYLNQLNLMADHNRFYVLHVTM